MKRTTVALSIVLASAGVAAITPAETARLQSAAHVVDAIRPIVPADTWTHARCVVVVPELKKAAFVVGGEFGRGVMTCRSGESWSAPAFVQLARGSWGFQAGAEQIDLVVLVMNESGVQKLLQNQVSLGADASIAAGPMGRQGAVATDAALKAEMLAYSRAQGLFAGVNLSGGVLRPDDEANRAAYGDGATARTILARRGIAAPTQATPLLTALGAGPTTTAPTTTAGNEPARSSAPQARATTRATTDDDVRARVVDIQQSVDRLLADTTPAAVGTSGSTGQPAAPSNATVVVERARLTQLRQQLDALLAALDRR